MLFIVCLSDNALCGTAPFSARQKVKVDIPCSPLIYRPRTYFDDGSDAKIKMSHTFSSRGRCGGAVSREDVVTVLT